MRIGFLTAPVREVPLEKTLKFAREAGFACLEVAAGPARKPEQRSGSMFDLDTVGPKDAPRILDLFDKYGLKVSCLASAYNSLDADHEKRRSNHGYVKKAILLAEALGVKGISTFAGRDIHKTIDENIKEYKKAFKPLVKFAEDHGVKLLFENCPMENWQFEGLIGNIACTPLFWEKLFDAVPSDYVGLNFDPSHLYWLGVDINKAVRDFAKKIHHTHAKDTEIFCDNLKRIGVLGQGILGQRWWIYRIPGLGQLEWSSYIRTLYEVGCRDVTLSIEHEDPIFLGTQEKTEQGFRLGQKFLSRFV